MRGIQKKKVRIRYDRIFICIIAFLTIAFLGFKFLNRKLENIYISGNTYLKDQEIIEIANIGNYPKMLMINSSKIKSLLLKNNYIRDISIKKGMTEIEIKVKEAYPIYYNANTKKTVLSNGKEVTELYAVPTLINYIPDTIEEEFIEVMSDLENEIITKISEIKYDPNIDSERFLLTMTDGNYVYININRFNLLNNYLTIISNFKGQKGIIYLDSGGHFEIFK